MADYQAALDWHYLVEPKARGSRSEERRKAVRRHLERLKPSIGSMTRISQSSLKNADFENCRC